MGEDANRDLASLQSNGLGGLDAVLGVRLVSASAEKVIVEYDVDERHVQPYGIVHGGMHATAVETACSTGAGFAARERGLAGVVGIENHTSFIRAVRQGRVRVTATPITRGRRSQLWEATARNEAGEIVSTGRVRLLVLEAGTKLAGEEMRVEAKRSPS